MSIRTREYWAQIVLEWGIKKIIDRLSELKEHGFELEKILYSGQEFSSNQVQSLMKEIGNDIFPVRRPGWKAGISVRGPNLQFNFVSNVKGKTERYKLIGSPYVVSQQARPGHWQRQESNIYLKKHPLTDEGYNLRDLKDLVKSLEPIVAYAVA